MKKYAKKILVIIMAIVCACSISITVNAVSEKAQPQISDLFGDDLLGRLKDILFPTTTQPAETTTADPPSETSTSQNPVSNTGSGTISTTAPTTYPYEQPQTTLPTTVPEETTTVPEPASEPFSSSLGSLLENDSAAQIIQPITEPFTIGGPLVVINDDGKGMPWQSIVLIAAAALFIILAALVVALIVQRNKQDDKNKPTPPPSNNPPAAPVVPEVMTPERIAELLGAVTGGTRTPEPVDYSTMTSAESAAAIKTAILMGQLTNPYTDPLIRKYSDDPIMITPSGTPASPLDAENMSGEDILKATDSMLSDITGDEKYANDVSGVNINITDTDDIKTDVPTGKVCPECGKPVSAGDVFCHNCGAYAG